MKLERRIIHVPDLTPEQIREICKTCQENGLPKDGLGKELKSPFSASASSPQI